MLCLFLLLIVSVLASLPAHFTDMATSCNNMIVGSCQVGLMQVSLGTDPPISSIGVASTSRMPQPGFVVANMASQPI